MSDCDFHSLGWWGMLTCAAVCVAAGLRSGDVSNLSVATFLVFAAAFFLVPHSVPHFSQIRLSRGV